MRCPVCLERWAKCIGHDPKTTVISPGFESIVAARKAKGEL